ncbi:MAG: hypothetical protein ACK559_21825, partial [bacterium]
MCDLARLHQFILRRLGSGDNCSVIPACDLLTGRNNTRPEDALLLLGHRPWQWCTLHEDGAR